MPFAIHSFKVDADGRIRIAHVFYGRDEDEAVKHLEEHADICPKYGPAYKADQTIEVGMEIDELPQPDETALQEFVGADEESDDE